MLFFALNFASFRLRNGYWDLKECWDQIENGEKVSRLFESLKPCWIVRLGLLLILFETQNPCWDRYVFETLPLLSFISLRVKGDTERANEKFIEPLLKSLIFILKPGLRPIWDYHKVLRRLRKNFWDVNFQKLIWDLGVILSIALNRILK